MTQAEIEAAARALAYKARCEHASHEDAVIYADISWGLWVDSAKAALAAAEQSRWQPIETAPKDGTLILGWAINLRTSMIRFVRNHKGPESYSGPMGGYADWQNRKGSDGWQSVESIGGWLVAPTHWQHLPGPPK